VELAVESARSYHGTSGGGTGGDAAARQNLLRLHKNCGQREHFPAHNRYRRHSFGLDDGNVTKRRRDLYGLVIAAFVACIVFAASKAADARELDPSLKQYVIASCSVDAMRLCPQSLGNESEAVACMKARRAELNQTCRVAYDKVVRTLRQ
jgi:hypothetical protein